MIISSNKLYVNWIDILPVEYDINFIKALPLYINTISLLNRSNYTELDYTKDIEYNQDNLRKYNSLTINEIYNILRNFLYEEIKSIKLLIYDMTTNIFSDKYLCIVFLANYFGEIINLALMNTNWDILDTIVTDDFTAKLKQLIDSVKNNTGLFVPNLNTTFTYESLERLLKALTISFDNQFSDRKLVKITKYKSLKTEYDELKKEFTVTFKAGTRYKYLDVNDYSLCDCILNCIIHQDLNIRH